MTTPLSRAESPLPAMVPADFGLNLVTAQWAARVGAAVVIAFWTSIGFAVQLLLLLMAIDLVTGIAGAATRGGLDSRVGAQGLLRKVFVLAIVAGAAACQPILGGVAIGQAVALFYASVEFLSILENAAAAGVPVPTWLTNRLAQIKQAAGTAPATPLPPSAPATGTIALPPAVPPAPPTR